MPSLKNIINKNSALRQALPHNTFLSRLPLFLLLFVFLGAGLYACAPTYPAKNLTIDIPRIVKEEEKLDVTCHLSGKTLWVYIPMTDLVDPMTNLWDAKGLEKMSKIISAAHRVLLSSDAKLNFLAIIATDVRYFGIELVVFEYVPDITEAVLEKFSRGEFFKRSTRDVGFNPLSLNDFKGTTKKYYDITFDEFLNIQIIHRTKTLFLKDKTLTKLFELKSTAHTEKFGILKIDMEFLRKSYNVSTEEEKINPLEYVRMIAALVANNYAYKSFQKIELRDTFNMTTTSLVPQDLSTIKIKLPEVPE